MAAPRVNRRRRSLTLSVLAIVLLAFNIVAASPRFGQRDAFAGRLRPRDVTGSGSAIDGQTFDYIIVGGGLAGLTVANRISEDSNYSVLVIEAGPDIYGAQQQQFLTPAANLYQSSLNTSYDWQWVTANQPGLGNREVIWPRGKVLGGSSSINGLYMVRASKIEHDAWGQLINAPDRWGWDAMLAAMKKSETFHAPTRATSATVPSLKFDQASHGTDGPVHAGWPAISYSSVEYYLQGCAALGIPNSNDPDGGNSWGSFVATSAIDNSNWQRSSSRTAYLNGADTRSNLRVLVNNQVTKVLTQNGTDSGLVNATGVQFAAYQGATQRTVYARREVILSGGAINSPALLQLSGIGDTQHLQQVGINTVIDLPGVGHNLQDHLSSGISYAPANGAQMPPSYLTNNPQIDSFVNSATAYVNTSTLFGDDADALLQSVRGNLSSTISSANVRDEVKRAYNATMSTQLNDIFGSPVGPIELLFALTFGIVQIQVALQHPLSRGSILINSAQPFDGPTIDPGYLTADIDLDMLRAGYKLARKIGLSDAMSSAVSLETSPGPSVSSDASWDAFIKSSVGTEYHPSSTCSMLPQDQGGVVDANMLVYGTSNLRVIDASVPPMAVSAHLMTITYGLAEIGAEIVIEARAPPPSSSTNTTSNGTNGSNGSNNAANGSNGSNNGTSGQRSNAAAAAVLTGSVLPVAAMTMAALLATLIA